MDIPDWRRKIDDIDEQLITLLNKRSEYVMEIGKIKKEHNLPISSQEREDEIIRRLNKVIS